VAAPGVPAVHRNGPASIFGVPADTCCGRFTYQSLPSYHESKE
jgi:hypothetical protein